MFTGIIQDIGTVRSITKKGDWRVEIETALDLARVESGASVACSGCCLTVTQKGVNWFAVDVSHETLSKTSISNWNQGTKINLELSLRLGDELGGHFVFGHVDGLAIIEDLKQEGDSWRVTIKPPQELMRYIASKGSVSLDGVSLTVNETSQEIFGVNIIPHTWAHTTLGAKKAGDRINLEIDMLARYVANIVKRQAA